MGLVGLVMVGFFIFLIGRVTTPQMGLLYSNLDIADSGAIVAQLEQNNVPFQVRANGSQIYVPANDVERIRVQVAQEGLPSGGSIGYEIFDRGDALGTTNFVQNVNLVRALEGELARTIRSFDNIEAARVHLVLPRRELFTRETREPSASVVIKTRGGRRVDPNQVRAIQHLVASATDGLTISRISVVDDAGNLLARAQDDNAEGGASDDTIAEVRLAAENRLRGSIERLIERTVGLGKVRAEVSVDLNYDRITENDETFDPDGQVVRSTQTVDENSLSVDRDDAPVTVANNLPEAEADQGVAGGSTSRNSRTEETTNFEISKSVTTRVREFGAVERLTVAVLVDGARTLGEDGTQVYTPRTQEELQQLAALVRNAVGYDESRGDQIEVVNMRFADVETPFLEDATGFLGLSKSDYFKIAEILLFMIIAILVILLVLRPLVGRSIAALQPQPEPAYAGIEGGGGAADALEGPAGSKAALSAEEEDPMISLGAVEGQIRASSVRKIGEIIDKHPDEALAILRTWIYEE